MTEDEYYTHCEDWHRDEPVDGCLSCDTRKQIAFCIQCGRQWVDGEMTATLRMEHFKRDMCAKGQHVLFGAYDNELLCPVPLAGQACGDPIATPGSVACDWHQAHLDVQAANRRMLAQAARR